MWGKLDTCEHNPLSSNHSTVNKARDLIDIQRQATEAMCDYVTVTNGGGYLQTLFLRNGDISMGKRHKETGIWIETLRANMSKTGSWTDFNFIFWGLDLRCGHRTECGNHPYNKRACIFLAIVVKVALTILERLWCWRCFDWMKKFRRKVYKCWAGISLRNQLPKMTLVYCRSGCEALLRTRHYMYYSAMPITVGEIRI